MQCPSCQNENLEHAKFCLEDYYLELGIVEEAISYFDRVLEEPGTLTHIYEPRARLAKALINLARDDLGSSGQEVDLAEQIIETSDMRIITPRYLSVKTELQEVEGNISGSIQSTQKAISLAFGFGFYPETYLFNRKLAGLANKMGDEALHNHAQEQTARSSQIILKRFMSEDLRQTYLRSKRMGKKELN